MKNSNISTRIFEFIGEMNIIFSILMLYNSTLSKIHPKNPKIPGIHPIHGTKKSLRKIGFEGERQPSLYLKGFIITKFSNTADALTLWALKGPLTDNIQISGIFNHKIMLECSLLI